MIYIDRILFKRFNINLARFLLYIRLNLLYLYNATNLLFLFFDYLFRNYQISFNYNILNY